MPPSFQVLNQLRRAVRVIFNRILTSVNQYAIVAAERDETNLAGLDILVCDAVQFYSLHITDEVVREITEQD